MDRSAVEKLVAEKIPALSTALGLTDWSISFSIRSESSAADGSVQRGECSRLIDYRSAHISLNADSFEDEVDALKTIRHELYHIVLAPIDLYSLAVDQAGIVEPASQILDRVWQYAVEHTVLNLERMYAGLRVD